MRSTHCPNCKGFIAWNGKAGSLRCPECGFEFPTPPGSAIVHGTRAERLELAKCAMEALIRKAPALASWDQGPGEPRPIEHLWDTYQATGHSAVAYADAVLAAMEETC